MNERPTLHVTNWSSTTLHGPGPKLTIMALPRSWEHGDGGVDILLPAATDLRAVQAGTLSPDAYRAAFEAKMTRALQEGSLQPHVGLMYNPTHRLAATSVAASAANATSFSVENGSTLCCACSKQKAAEGRCHRVWAAKALAAAGWNVILDGTPVASSNTRDVDVFVRDGGPSETARTSAGIPCNPLFPWALPVLEKP